MLGDLWVLAAMAAAERRRRREERWMNDQRDPLDTLAVVLALVGLGLVAWKLWEIAASLAKIAGSL